MSSVKRRDLLPPIWLFSILALALIFWLLVQLKEIAVLLVLGYCFAFVIEPVVKYLESKKLQRSWALFLLLALAVVLILTLVMTVLPSLAKEYTVLSNAFPDLIESAKSTLVSLSKKYAFLATIEHFLSSPLDLLSEFGGLAFPKIKVIAYEVLLRGYSVTMTIINVTLLPFIIYYISLDFPTFRNRFLNLFPVIRRRKAAEVLDEINTYTAAFVRGQFSVCTILFCLYAVGMLIIGVNFWLILALITGFGNLIPYLGFVTGIVLTTLVTLVSFGDLTHVLYVWILFAIVQMLEGFLITPKIIGNTVGLSPLIIILALMAGGTLFGLLGIFLAVPAAAVFKVLFREAKEWLDNLS